MMGKIRNVINYLLIFFCVYIASLFILGIVFVSLLAISLNKVTSEDSSTYYRHLYLILIGAVASVLAFATIIVSRSVIFLSPVSLAIKSASFPRLLYLGIVLVFSNIIMFPILTNWTLSFRNRRIKSLIILILVMLSISIIFIHGSSRTHELETNLIDEAHWIIDAAYDHYEYITPRSLWMWGVYGHKIFSLRHSILQYVIADIYAFFVVGVFSEKNYSVIIVGTGVFLANYITETGVYLVKKIDISIQYDVDYNVSPVKKFVARFISFLGASISRAVAVYLLFNTSNINSIKISWRTNWIINSVTLCDGLEVGFLKDYPVVQMVNMTSQWRHGIYSGSLTSYYCNYRRLQIFGLYTLMIFDPLTSLLFYKYELMLASVALIALSYTLKWLRDVRGRKSTASI